MNMLRRGAVLRAGAIVFVLAALAYAGRALWSGTVTPRGSEKDAVILVCSKCDQESILPSAEYKKLARDPVTGIQCPKCGEKAAQTASTRCPHCKRAMPPQPHNAPMVCPFCKKSLLVDDEDEAPLSP